MPATVCWVNSCEHRCKLATTALLKGEKPTMSEGMPERLPEEFQLPVVWVGTEEVPLLFANQVLGQVGQQGEVVLTFGQLPTFNKPLTHPVLLDPLRDAARNLRYALV